MVSPSVPLYPDWHQQRNQVQGGVLRSSSDDQHPRNQFLSPPAAMPPGSGNMGLGSRPGSMAERARMANLQQPQAALKCPRCDSNNTKFCYFNNYSLSQPRHFCKTCRRYWTRGGAMRNVPVGGGCRRNKRSKSRSSRSKSPAPTRSAPFPAEAPDILSHLPPFPQPPFLPTSALHHFGEFGENELGLNFGSMMMMSAASDAGVGVLSGLDEQWRMQQQFPLLTGLDPPVSSGLFHSIGQGEQRVEPSFCGGASQVRARQGVEPGMTNQVAGAVKLEEQNHNHSHLYHKGGEGLMLTSTPSRNISGINMNHHQYGWAGDDQNASTAWPHDLSSPGFTNSFSSTTTSHLP